MFLLSKRTDVKVLLLLCCCFLTAISAFAQTAIPVSNWNFNNPLQEQSGWQIAAKDTVGTIPLSDNTATDFSLRFGATGSQATLLIHGSGGKVLLLALSANDIGLPVDAGKNRNLPDAVINITLTSPEGDKLFNGKMFVPPNPMYYLGEERKALLDKWDSLPKASEQPLQVKITLQKGYAGIWLNDHYIGGAEVELPATLELKLQPGNAIEDISTAVLPEEKFVPVGLQGYRRPGLTFNAPELQLGRNQTIDGVPFEVAEAGDDIDVGKSRWLRPAAIGGFTDPYYSRSSFDNVPENIMLAVPNDDYSYAHVLCVVDSSTDKMPVLTLRFTRYASNTIWNGGVGDAIADSVIRLEQKDGKWPEGVRQIGEVKSKDDKTLPLLDVTLPVRSSEIPDIIDGYRKSNLSTQYLDLELTKELHLAQASNYANMTTKPLGKPSGVNVLALTLERAAVKVRSGERQAGNVFYSNEKVGFDVKMLNRTGDTFTGNLAWKLTDYYGKTQSGEQKVLLGASTGETTVPLNISGLEAGWYKADLTLTDATNRVVWQQPTSLAVLAPDTRKASAESPFGTWWDRGDHGGTASIAEVAPLLQRMGFRHVSPGGVQYKESGNDFAKYGISASMIAWPIGRNLDQAKKFIDEQIARYPNAKYAMIFHESGYGTLPHFPREAIGKPPSTLDEKQKAAYDKLMAVAIPYAQYIRQKYPQLKLIVGNGDSGFTRGLMENGWPKELVDYWGDETLGQSVIPEAPTGNSWFWLDQYSQKYGYDKPVTSCFEWRGRGTNPGNLTELEQAQFYTRDVLMAMSYNALNINPGMLYDSGDMYYYSRWGANGFTKRYPLMTPKISYVAMAVLTQQLDQAKFVRTMPVNSPSLNVLEFKTGNTWTYALWTPRGETQAAITFDGKAGSPALVDMNGRAIAVKIQNNQTIIPVSASPAYLHTGVRLATITGGNTVIPIPAKISPITDSMDASNWSVATQWDKTHDPMLLELDFDVPREQGSATLKDVNDAQMGHVLQVTPQTDPNAPWPIAHTIVLKPKQPIQLSGSPQNVGIWVKGNSSWGRIYFELKDASGQRYFSFCQPAGGWDLLEWKGETYINFDGWNFISVKLPGLYADGLDEPQNRNWYLLKGRNVQYPVQLEGIFIDTRSKIIQANKLLDVPNPDICLQLAMIN